MRFLIVIISCFLIASANAQITIQGVVFDESGRPVEGVSVFLSNTTFSDFSDSVGGFTIIGMKGDHQLIAYKAGYQLYSSQINRLGKLRIRLKRVREKEDASGKDAYSEIQMEDFMRTFKNDFLGLSRNAENCEILNPEAIKFELVPELLKATSEGPIIIRNKRMGYDLAYFLVSYERTSKTSSYVGHARYEDTPGLELSPKHYGVREKAYKGSVAHFLQSVLAGKHNREGFRLQTATQVGDGWLYKEVPISNLAVYNEEGVFLFGAGKFRIVYLPERREYNFVRWLKANGIKEVGRGQYTEMEFATQKVKILPSGTLDPPLGLIFRGYMGWEKMGEALPMNYNPR